MSLGSIVVRLSMQTADFETDAGRAAKVAQRRSKEIGDAFNKAGVMIGVALGAAMAGTVVALKSAINSMDETYNAAKKVGDSTENFSRLKYAAGLADVGMDQLVTTLGKLTKSQAAALDVGSQQAKVFRALGIAVEDSSGKLRGSTDVMLDFADRFAEMKGSPEAMAAGFALFGRSFQDMIPFLEMGSDEIRRLMTEADALGITLSESAGAAADKFKDQLDKLQGAANGVWKDIAAGLLPALDDSAKRLTVLAADGDLARNATTLLSAALGFGVGALEGYNNAVARTTIAIEAFAGAAAGAWEIQKNLMTLGLADGSLAGGYQKGAQAYANADKQLKQLISDQELRKAGMTRDQYNKQFIGQFGAGIPGTGASLFPALPFNFAADQSARSGDRNAAVRGALGGSPARTGSARGSSGKSEAERMAEQAARAADQAAEAQRRWHGSILDMEATLAGPAAEAQREYERSVAELNADFNKGHILLADYAKGLDLYAESRDKALAAINARKTPAQELLEDLEFERSLIGKTREEQELLTAARWLDADAMTAQGQAALNALTGNQDYEKQMEAQIEGMDAVREGMGDLFTDLRHGVNAWDALTSAASSFFDKIAQALQDRLLEQLFGQMGSASGGSSGGWFSTLFSVFGSLFGGGGSTGLSMGSGSQFAWAGAGYARGGYTGPGGVNEPAGTVHRGEVVWSQGDVARSGGVANVEAMRRGAGSGGASRVTTPVVVIGDRAVSNAMAGLAGRDVVMTHVRESIDEIRSLL